MEIRRLQDAQQFRPDKMVKASLFQTDRLFYDLYCLEAGQAQKVHSHAASDKVYLVIEGRAAVTIGDEEQELAPTQAALAPAGVAHGVRNPGPARLVLLVVTTPPPV